MTVAALSPTIVYNENGVTTSYAVPFRFNDPSHIKAMRIALDGSLTQLAYDTDYSVTGGTTDGGGTLTVNSAGAIGVRLAITRVTPRSQPMDYTTGDTFPANSHETALDRLTLISQELDASVIELLNRAVIAAYGEGGGVLPPSINLRGKYLARNADDEWYGAEGTGADSALRSELAESDGATKIGVASGGSLQTKLNNIDLSASLLSAEVDAAQSQITAIEAAAARMQKMFPPFTQVAGVFVGDVVPTASSPMAAKRLHADWILVRVRSTTLAGVSLDDVYWDEYYFRNSRGYADVASGWQLVYHAAYYNSRYSTWLSSPDNPGGIPNSDFALRLGLYASDYHSGGEGPAYYYTGFGHGRAAASDADISIIKDGGGSNLNPIAAWPVGTTLLGSTLDFTTNFKLRTLTATLGSNPIATTSGSGTITVTHTSHGYSTGQWVKLEGVPFAGINGLTYAQLIERKQITVLTADTYTIATSGSATSTGSGGGAAVQAFADVVNLTYTQSFGTMGLRRKGAYSASLAGYAIQDSYGFMLPVNSWEVTHFKPSGQTAIALARDSVQKGNWAGSSNTALYHQAYNDAKPTIMQSMYLEYGQPLRKALGGLSAWAQNNNGRYFFRDLPDYAKYYVFINSSEEGLPRTAWPMTVDEVYEWQSLLRTEYRAGGPR